MEFNYTQPPTDEYGEPISEDPNNQGVALEGLRVKDNSEIPTTLSSVASPFDKIFTLSSIAGLLFTILLAVWYTLYDLSSTAMAVLVVIILACTAVSFVSIKIGKRYFKKWGGKTRPTTELFR